MRSRLTTTLTMICCASLATFAAAPQASSDKPQPAQAELYAETDELGDGPAVVGSIRMDRTISVLPRVELELDVRDQRRSEALDSARIDIPYSGPALRLGDVPYFLTSLLWDEARAQGYVVLWQGVVSNRTSEHTAQFSVYVFEAVLTDARLSRAALKHITGPEVPSTGDRVTGRLRANDQPSAASAELDGDRLLLTLADADGARVLAAELELSEYTFARAPEEP